MQIEKRNIGVCVLLSIVTCGIYGIIWAVKMLREAVQIKDQSDDGLAEILLGIFLCPVGFYMAEKKFSEGCQARGIAHEDRTVMYLILGFVGLGIVDYIMMQSDLNKISDMFAGAAPYGQDPYQSQQPPYQQPQYGQPQYQQPQYGQPQYQQPQYGQPQYGQPQYQQPQYQQPQQPYPGNNQNQ